jgi:AraC family transcriptional regulator
MALRLKPITLGEQVKSCEVAGFILTETLHSPNLTLPRHEHESANLNFVLKGYFKETIGNRPYECEHASLLIKPAGETHSNEYGHAQVRCLAIELKPDKLETIRSFSKLFDHPAHYRGGLLSPLAMQVYGEFRAMDDVSPLMIEGLVLELMEHASRSNLRAAAQPRWLKDAREIVHEHFTEPLSLFHVAATVGVHPSQLARMFRKHYQCTVGTYVRRLRLDYAARELIESQKTLAEVALMCGCYDQSHFAHLFTRHFKWTPAQFRNLFQHRHADTKSLRFSKTV